MDDLKQIIAGNISKLRRQRGMTQLDLANALNYSDKAISKWERGESVPDVTVLKSIADLFGVGVDYLLEESHGEASSFADYERSIKLNHGFITGICIALVALIATFLFVIFSLIGGFANFCWLFFIYAVPVAMIVWLVLNSIWFSHRRNFLIISILMWSALVATYLTCLFFGLNLWLIFVLGPVGQVIILLWSGIRFPWKKSGKKADE